MAWTKLPTRTSGADLNSAADVNQLQTNLNAVKGGAADDAPTQTMEQTITRVGTAESDVNTLQSDVDALELSQDGNVRASESGTITAATIAENRMQTYTLSGTADRKLPTTGVLKGWVYHWINPGTYALTVKSSDGVAIQAIMNAYIKVQALQDTPIGIAHWQIISCRSLYVEKEYAGGTAPTVTSAAAGFTHLNSAFIPYQTIDGKWHVKGYINSSQNSTTTITVSVSGISIINYQSAAVQRGYCYTPTGGFDITFDASYTLSILSFDLFLSAKPSWAT